MRGHHHIELARIQVCRFQIGSMGGGEGVEALCRFERESFNELGVLDELFYVSRRSLRRRRRRGARGRGDRARRGRNRARRGDGGYGVGGVADIQSPASKVEQKQE